MKLFEKFFIFFYSNLPFFKTQSSIPFIRNIKKTCYFPPKDFFRVKLKPNSLA